MRGVFEMFQCRVSQQIFLEALFMPLMKDALYQLRRKSCKLCPLTEISVICCE